MKKDPLIYLNHMLECTRKIQQYTAGLDQEAFLNQPLIQDAVIRNLEIIGEATKQLDADFRAKHAYIE